MWAPALAVTNLQVRILKDLVWSDVLSFLNFITAAINTYTIYSKSYENSFYVISSVFCLVCVQISSSFLTNSTELSCSASLEILVSWGWKLHSQGPTTEPCPEVNECRPSPITGSKWVWRLSLQHLFPYIISCLQLFAGIFVFSKHFQFLFMHQS
jgi:hypothetical protein